MKLHVKAFALTCALVWGIGLCIATWWIVLLDGASQKTTFIGLVYRGYTLSPIGSAYGLLWGFVDGLIGGALFAWLYNCIVGRIAKDAG